MKKLGQNDSHAMFTSDPSKTNGEPKTNASTKIIHTIEPNPEVTFFSENNKQSHVRRTDLLSTDQESNLIEAFDVAQAEQHADLNCGDAAQTVTKGNYAPTRFVECRQMYVKQRFRLNMTQFGTKPAAMDLLTAAPLSKQYWVLRGSSVHEPYRKKRGGSYAVSPSRRGTAQEPVRRK